MKKKIAIAVIAVSLFASPAIAGSGKNRIVYYDEMSHYRGSIQKGKVYDENSRYRGHIEKGKYYDENSRYKGKVEKRDGKKSRHDYEEGDDD